MMQGFVIDGPGAEKISAWLRTCFWDTDSDNIYLPCGAFASEKDAYLRLAFDGISIVYSEGHIYAPSSWLIREYPKRAWEIETITQGAKVKIAALKGRFCIFHA